jgi:hypothetical protein
LGGLRQVVVAVTGRVRQTWIGAAVSQSVTLDSDE